jgi:putative nucleotidyltransferase with HDIG domain
MEQEKLEKFKSWFGNYVAGFYGDDEFVNANLKLKEAHSLRTCEEMLYLANELGLDGNSRRIAEVIALFHDIGRFEQFIRYRTYNDVRSINHCLLGIDVLRKMDMLAAVEKEEKELIEKAIEYHGIRQLPAGLDGRYSLFCRLIRDADKIDIFYVVTEYYRQYREKPQEFMLELEFPDRPVYSAEVVKEILAGRRLDYSKLRTLNDMKLLQVGWVYDVNFAATLRRIKQRGFLKMLFDFLPETEDIKKVREKIFNFVDSRIQQEKLEN